MAAQLVSISQASEMLGLPRSKISAGLDILEITPKVIPTNGKAKGLTLQEVAKIEKLYKLRRKPASATSP